MSDEKEVAQKLEEALRRYGADYGFVVTDKSVRKLIDGSAYATVEVKTVRRRSLPRHSWKSARSLNSRMMGWNAWQ